MSVLLGPRLAPLSRAEEDILQTVARWERDYPYRRPPKSKPQPKQAAQTTIDALIYGLRTHGAAHLEDADCQRRLDDLSREQFDDLIKRLQRIQPPVSEDLISSLEEFLHG